MNQQAISKFLLASIVIPCIMNISSFTTCAFTTFHKRSVQRLYSSSKSARKNRKEGIKNLGTSQKELNWDHYDFSSNPKQEGRFNNQVAVAANEQMDPAVEAIADQQYRQEMNHVNELYYKLDPETVKKATELLLPLINEERLKRVGSVLKQRTRRTKFLFENPANPSNVWACLRTIDSFGVQNVDLVIDSNEYYGKQAMNQKRGMRTAMGSAQWLTLTNHASTKEAIRQIKEKQGYKIYASDLNPNSKDVRDIDWDAGPICVVMGNEDRGISQEMRDLADETFTLPMCGFAESFNLSAATSITLAHMSAKSSQGKGPLRPGDMDEHEYNCLYLKGLMNSLPQRRTGPLVLKQNNIVLPNFN